MRGNHKECAMPRFFFDMDGVLAKWRCVPVEETHREGYFISLDPEPSVVKAVRDMRDKGYDVSILSAVYQDGHSAMEKADWLDEYGLGDIPRVFVPYGGCKADYVGRHRGISVLVDDYSKNLHEWSAGRRNIGVKFRNGVNGTHGTWTGCFVEVGMPPETLVRVITTVASSAALAV